LKLELVFGLGLGLGLFQLWAWASPITCCQPTQGGIQSQGIVAPKVLSFLFKNLITRFTEVTSITSTGNIIPG